MRQPDSSAIMQRWSRFYRSSYRALRVRCWATEFDVSLAMKASCELKTEIGGVSFLASASSPGASGVECRLQTFDFSADLFDEHSVKRCRAVVLHARSSGQIEILFDCVVDTVLKGGNESGQGLYAQAWYQKSAYLLIGTDDEEALAARLPKKVVELAKPNPVEYRPDGFRVRLSAIEGYSGVSLHYVVVENEYPEPKDCSSYFAASISHTALLRKANQPLQRTSR